MGFIPKYCLINLLCSVGTRRKNDGGISKDGGDDNKKEKKKNLLERIKMHKELALKAMEATASFRGSAVTW